MIMPALAMSPSTDPNGAPVEMIVVGCSLTAADGFANTLRNQDQAAHLRVADSIATLDQQIGVEPSDLFILSIDSLGEDLEKAVDRIRAVVPSASILAVSAHPDQHRRLAIDLNLADLLPIEDAERIAHAVRREHQTQSLRDEVAKLRGKLDEAEERSNLLVQSSRDAIAYIHEGMYLATNQAYLDMFGCESADEIDGLPIMDMIDASSRGDFKAALRKVDEVGKHIEEFRCIATDGQDFHARMEFLPAAIDGERCTQVIVRDQSQNLALQKRIEELTSKDAQTGFFNRQAFLERLEGLLESGDSDNQDHALVQVSISNYADLREECGFDCAEKMLTEVASVIGATVSNAHTIARFGDHDFMILCDGDEPPLEVAERCLHNLRGHAFQAIQDAPIEPTYSIGVTRADNDRSLTAYELVNHSCRATGIARAEGENRVVFYNQQIPSDTSQMAEEDASIVELIDQALANDGFRLKYQPIVSLQGDTRENYSVYLRLLDEHGSELVPDVFLSPARDASRLAEIDRWVVRNAIRELVGHRRDGQKVVFYIILSLASIQDDSMLLWICDCLREFRAKGSWLVFQFRASDLRGALGPARELIQGLKKINCRIAINHYQDESATMLKHLDADIVKLSPEYMRNLATDVNQQQRMQTTNSELQAAGYKTVASSLEDASSLAILWNIGINYIQGYFLQEPANTITFDEAQE